ncbi:unnamed protein product [Linum tenue]|uniref:MORF/ORRM1/DAG-like MORF domain-containing protein n=1 Tax=Linum tenue TaxID=586396 RepID=A0AAV0S2H1_9ROSI|nr:unnamed protein product [Linum tenue]
MAQTLARSSRHLPISSLITKRLISSSSSSAITRPPSPTTLLFSRRPLLPISPAARSVIPVSPPRLTAIRCLVNSAGNLSERPPAAEMAQLYPGCDRKHWLVVFGGKPGGEGVTKQQMIDRYIKAEENAKKKIYSVSCEGYFGFGCEIDEVDANRLEEWHKQMPLNPNIRFVLPDAYVDPEYRDYGGELFVNGEIVARSPERERRVRQLQKSSSQN